MNPDRAAMLLSFKEESEILTKRQIMDRAFVRNTYLFTSMIEQKLIAALPWEAGNKPREYVLTPLGKDRREMVNVAENLGYG